MTVDAKSARRKMRAEVTPRVRSGNRFPAAMGAICGKMLTAKSPDIVYELPGTPNGPQAKPRAELDAFGRVIEAEMPAGIVEAAEAFAGAHPQSELLSMVRLREMHPEMETNSFHGAIPIGHELLGKNPDNLGALLSMAEILPDFPPQYPGWHDAILAKAGRDIEFARWLLQTLRPPQGASVAESLDNKRGMAVSHGEASAFVELVAGRYQAGIQEYQWALAHGANPSPVTSFRLGWAYYEAGDTREARTHLEEVMRSPSGVIRRKAAEVLKKLEDTQGSLGEPSRKAEQP